MGAIWKDFRLALRLLAKNSSFAVTSIFTLALGIGAATAIFSVVYGVLLRPLPYRDADKIVRLWEQNDHGGRMNFADPNFEDVRAQNHTLASLAEYGVGLETVIFGSEASRTMMASVSRDFLRVMAVQPVFGRAFTPEEQQPDAPPAAMISHGYWQQSFGGTQDLASIRMRINGQPVSIIGVLPAGFRFPENADLWVPRELFERYPSRTAHNWQVIGRLNPSSNVNAARTELSTIARNLKQQYGRDTAMVTVAVEPLREAMTGKVRSGLLILLGGSMFLLVIAGANVMNLLLAQAMGREKEISVRAALGAGGAQLLRQFLAESFGLSLLGGTAGMVLAYGGLKGLLALAPDNLPRLDEISINVPVLLFSLATILAATMGLGLFTAYRAISAEPGGVLNETGRGQSGTSRKQRLNRLIVAGQLAIAMVLLVAAGLLGRSLVRVLRVDSGFRTEGVLTMELRLSEAAKKSERIAFLNSLLAQLRQVPSVQEVGASNVLPLSDGMRPDGTYVIMNPLQISPVMQDLIRRSLEGSLEKDPVLLEQFSRFFEDLFHDQAHTGEADYAAVTEGYFQALNIPLLRGRLFDPHDTIDAPHVAVISQSLAKEKWPEQDAVGRSIEFGNMDGDPRLLTVVGVVGDVRDHSLESAPRPIIYVNYRQRPQTNYTIFMRTSTPDNQTVVAAARKIVHDLDAAVPPRFSTLANVYRASLGARRFSLTLGAIFAGAAVLLAIAGIYGVTSYSVAQRTREIGVRMALGASTTKVMGMVLRQGALTGLAGVAVGMAAALALTRWIEAQLFEVSASDPLTLAGVAALLLLVSLLACWVPGRRATQVDPVVALRYE
jgi:ABC-type antimicrobial peptide transport system permease subunit